MQYPTLTPIPERRETVDVFGGYDHRSHVPKGSFYEMENLSGLHYPLLATRPPRRVHRTPTTATCLFAKGALCYLDGTTLFINDYSVDLGLSPYHDLRFATMGAHVIFITMDKGGNVVDKKWVNTENPTLFGNVDAEFTATTSLTLELCRHDGVTYSGVVSATTPPEAPASGDLWLDTSDTPVALRQYSASLSQWVAVQSTCVRLSCAGIGKSFAAGDGVQIENLTGDAFSTLLGNHVIRSLSDDHIVIDGILDRAYTVSDPVTISRKMPMMDFIIESGNRLWGCRYGTANDGSVVNEIYASKLGDFRNWQCFEGISTDSYAVSVGSDGAFTGAITHLGYPLFFKENHLHKVYGSYPATFSLQSTPLCGVEKGSHLSLVSVGEVLYYKGTHGFFAYDGSLPVEISLPLGGVVYRDAVAGSVGGRYHVSMKDEDGKPHLFVFDTRRALWHREDGTDVKQFATHGGRLYCIDKESGAILCYGEGEERVSWMAQSGALGTDDPARKYVSHLTLRLTLPRDSRLSVQVEYDDEGVFRPVATLVGKSRLPVSLPLVLRRCDHFRLKLQGVGQAKLSAITMTILGGGNK